MFCGVVFATPMETSAVLPAGFLKTLTVGISPLDFVWRGQSSYRIATLLLAAFVVKASDFRGGFLNFTYAFFDNLLGVVLVDGRHVPLIN